MNYDELDIKDYGDVVCPEYSGNICHTLKQKEKELEIYKRALEQIANDYSFNTDGRALVLDYLQKAREEE